MMAWATVPYATWQLFYHFFITVRRREKIAAGRPTSFTWLRRSYAKTWIGKFVLRQPKWLQEPSFMMIQYCYALLTMIPCPIWFWYRLPSAAFLMAVFIWSVYNGATYYIDIFGKRFQNELEQLKKDVAKWQASPAGIGSPEMVGQQSQYDPGNGAPPLTLGQSHAREHGHQRQGSAPELGSKNTGIESIPLLDSSAPSKQVPGGSGISAISTGLNGGVKQEAEGIRGRMASGQS
jgi:hypothetical protein